MTWQEIKLIVNIADDIVENYKDKHDVLYDEEAYYKEVLEQYNKAKMKLENTEFSCGHSVLDYEL